MSSNKIENNAPVKEQFNPHNKNHLSIVKEFFKDNKWGQHGCPFVLEWPYEDIPYMVKTKISEHFLKV